MSARPSLVNLEEAEARAAAALEGPTFDFVAAGAGDEVALAEVGPEMLIKEEAR